MTAGVVDSPSPSIHPIEQGCFVSASQSTPAILTSDSSDLSRTASFAASQSFADLHGTFSSGGSGCAGCNSVAEGIGISSGNAILAANMDRIRYLQSLKPTDGVSLLSVFSVVADVFNWLASK